MEVEIKNKKDNVLLKRIEVDFTVSHPKSATPKRNEIRDAIATTLGAKKDAVVIDNLETVFGKPVTFGYAKVYKSVEDARTMELKHIQKRNHIFVEKKQAEEAKK